jgi:asparagine synthase (glutamine-hydrolysing)
MVMGDFYCIYGDRFVSPDSIGREFWENDPHLWVKGYLPTEIISWDEGTSRVLVVGDVLDTLDECKKKYTLYKKNRNLSCWAELAGNTTVIIQEGNKTLFLPNLCQLHPIYYMSNKNGILVSTSKRWIQQMMQACIDDKSVAISLLCAGMTELAHRFSLFEGISIVPAHHALMITPAGVHTVPVHYSVEECLDLAEGANALRADLIKSIQLRVDKYSRISCDFSGGLDSTSLGLLAARFAKHKVHGITFSSIHEREDVAIATEFAAG